MGLLKALELEIILQENDTKIIGNSNPIVYTHICVSIDTLA